METKENKNHNVETNEKVEKKWKGKQGKAYVKLGELKDSVRIENSNYAVFFDNPFDANLFADALNTIQKCNLYPSELYQISLQVNENSLSYKEQIDELLKGLNLINQMSDCGSYLDAMLKMKSIANELIKKIKG